ncbi:MAG: hypothetical protein KF869_02415 [Phycisphaeraceae bacterium]|nr:hypothetical protein [Phycisphaeraceae bacterium]
MFAIRNTVSPAGAALVCVPMLVLGVSSVAKFADMPQFVASPRTWTLVPTSLVLPVAFLVVACEFAISIWWFIGGQRIACALAGAVLLLCFAGAYALHLALGIRPSCACMGALQQVIEARTEGGIIAIRAASLAVMLLLGASLAVLGDRFRAAAASKGTT